MLVNIDVQTPRELSRACSASVSPLAYASGEPVIVQVNAGRQLSLPGARSPAVAGGAVVAALAATLLLSLVDAELAPIDLAPVGGLNHRGDIVGLNLDEAEAA